MWGTSTAAAAADVFEIYTKISASFTIKMQRRRFIFGSYEIFFKKENSMLHYRIWDGWSWTGFSLHLLFNSIFISIFVFIFIQHWTKMQFLSFAFVCNIEMRRHCEKVTVDWNGITPHAFGGNGATVNWHRLSETENIYFPIQRNAVQNCLLCFVFDSRIECVCSVRRLNEFRCH